MKRKIPIFAFTLISALSLTSCDESPFNAESFLSKLFPQPWDALAVFLAFIVLVLVAFYFGFKPIKKLINARKDYVEGNIKTAEEREQKSRNLVSEAEKQVSESKKEAIAIVEKAREDALKQKEIIVKEAKDEALKEKEKAKEEIALEIEASKDEIHREIVSVALDASKKVLEREVNEKDNERLIDDFIDEVNKEDK